MWIGSMRYAREMDDGCRLCIFALLLCHPSPLKGIMPHPQPPLKRGLTTGELTWEHSLTPSPPFHWGYRLGKMLGRGLSPLLGNDHISFLIS